MKNVLYDNKTDRFIKTQEEINFSLLTACLHVGYKCNLACPYCFNQFENDEIEDKGDLAIFSAISKLKIKRLVISGGEPFVYQDRLYSLLETAKKHKIATMVSTNGTLLSEKVIDKFLPVLNFVDVSLPATNSKDYFSFRGFDGFQKAILAIKTLIQKGVKVRLTFTVSKDNFESAKNLPKLIEELEVKNVRIGYVYNDNGLIDQLLDLKEIVKGVEKAGAICYKPIEGELFEAYKKGYLILRLDGNSYLSSPQKENFVANILEKDEEKLFEIFSDIAKNQRKLFCE